jgi:hypothetical protein
MPRGRRKATRRARSAADGRLGAAVQNKSVLTRVIRPGLQALRSSHRPQIQPDPRNLVTDSLGLDDAFSDSEPEQSRWDYWLGTSIIGQALIGVEVHPATAGEVAKLVQKKQWAERKAAGNLLKTKRIARWYWVSSGSTKITKTSAEYRRLGKAGIELVGGTLRLRQQWRVSDSQSP